MGAQCLKSQKKLESVTVNINQMKLAYPNYICSHNTDNEEINKIQDEFANLKSKRFISPKYITKKIFKEDLDLLEIQKQFNIVVQDSFYSCKTIKTHEISLQNTNQSIQIQGRPLKGILKQQTYILVTPIISKKRLSN